MRIIDLLKMGFRNLARRKARTALTIIGVIIGTISIMVMISIGIGMNKSFEESIMENGSMTTIYVSAYAGEFDENGEWIETTQTLTQDTINKLKEIEHVKSATPIIYAGGQFSSGKFSSWASLMVMDMSCYEEFGYPALENGEYPDEEMIKEGFFVGKEAIYDFSYWNGNTTKTKDVDFYNDKIEFTFNDYASDEKKKSFSFPVQNRYAIGGNEDGGWSEADYYIFMDYDFYTELYRKYANTLKIEDRKRVLKSLESFSNITINVDNMNNVTDVQEKISEIGLKSESNMQYIKPMQETANMLELILGAIGGVAMLVSAINIANTMIMSIYERTKEIGIMKVLGCKVSDIKKLFLLEAGLIGFIGGVIGVGLSYIVSWAFNKFGADIFSSLIDGSVAEGTGVSYIPLWLPFFSAGFGILVGLISGFIPAVRATRISAIEAMKNE